MDTEEDRGPRSTEEAYALLRADAIERVLADPESMLQPWNESRPAGWPLAEAVFAFAHESVRGQVSLQLALAAEGYAVPIVLDRLAEGGWDFMRQRLSKGELTATGIAQGLDDDPRSMHPSVFDQADFDRATGTVIAVGLRYGAVRIFEGVAAATVPPIKIVSGRNSGRLDYQQLGSGLCIKARR